jgi:beta-phosphoglucomutase
MIKLVCFDLDGVLVDACEWHRIALNEALLEICNYEISLNDHYSIYNGLPTKIKLNMLAERGLIQKELIPIISQKKQFLTSKIIENYAKPREEKIELLQYLVDNSKILCCYTNSIRDSAFLMLEKTNILNYFRTILSNQDVEKPKPDPEGYLFLMNYYKIKPEETIIIEDSPTGFEAAYKSGAKVFKVNNADEVNLKLFKGFI